MHFATAAVRDPALERNSARGASGIFPLARNQLNEVEIADERSRPDGPNGKSFNRRSLLSHVSEKEPRCCESSCARWLSVATTPTKRSHPLVP